MKRESFKSRLGFLLVSAGCAIGIGNVWRFPYVTGQNGGGIFVLFYLIFLVCMGLPVLTMERAVGRASRKSAVMSYKALEKEGIPMLEADVTMIPQTWVELTDENDIKYMNRLLDLLDDDDDVQAVYHNWDTDER